MWIEAHKARSIGDLLREFSEYVLRTCERTWQSICGLLMDPEGPTILLLQNFVRRRGRPRLYIETDHIHNLDYENWYQQNVLSPNSETQLVVELHVSDYHLGDRKKKTKDPWNKRKYLRIGWEY